MVYLLDHGWPVFLAACGATFIWFWLGLRHGGVRVGYLSWALGIVASVLFVILVAVYLTREFGVRMSRELLHGFTVPLVWILIVVPIVVIAVLLAHRRLYAPRRSVAVEFTQGVSEHHSPSVSGKALTVAGQAVPEEDETRHFRIVGDAGAGRSTAIRELLAGGLARGDRAVIADPDGEYLRLLYKPERGDVILNPFEPRAARWDLFAEIERPHDADQLALALIPDTEGLDRNWRGYARILMTSVLRQLNCVGERDLRVLHWLLAMAPTVELRHLLESTSAAPLLARDNGKLFESVRLVGSALVAPMEHLTRQISGRKMSVRKWIREGRGVLFLPYRAHEVATLRGLISAWTRIAILEAIGGEEMDRRFWFVVDELDVLGAINGLSDALPRMRKFGGRCVLGFHNVGQLRDIYGDAEARAIVQHCENTLILRCSAGPPEDAAEFASQLIGKREVLRNLMPQTRRPRMFGALDRMRAISNHYVTEGTVMASDIELLPDFIGYLRLASQAQWRRVRLLE